MALRVQLDGANSLLTSMYGRPTRVGTLMADLGFDGEQLDRLKREYLQALLGDFRAVVDHAGTRWSNQRIPYVLCRRLGLDGQPPETLQQLGEQFGISRERVRQLQATGLRRLTGRRHKRFLEDKLRETATGLVGLPHAEPVAESAHTPMPSATVGSSPPAPGSTEDRERILAAAREILLRVDGWLSFNLITHVLVGSNGPVVRALVGHFELPHYGSYTTLGHSAVKEILRGRCPGDHGFRVSGERVRAAP